MDRNLDAEKLVSTIEQLHERVKSRFPQAGLREVCQELCVVASEVQERARWIERPQIALRVAVVAAMGVVAGLFVILPIHIGSAEGLSFSEFVANLEAGINIVVVAGAGILFLVTAETRIKRRGALKAIHELRSMAHVIDIRQLTKDPGRLYNDESTPESPKMDLTPFLLSRYLDYCSEMLSIIGKLAALYVQRFDDPVVLNAANDVENLTSGLSRKIWQKLMILHEFRIAAERQSGEKKSDN